MYYVFLLNLSNVLVRREQYNAILVYYLHIFKLKINLSCLNCLKLREFSMFKTSFYTKILCFFFQNEKMNHPGI